MRTALLSVFLVFLAVTFLATAGAVTADTDTPPPPDGPATTSVPSFDPPGSGLVPAAIAVGSVPLVALLAR